MKRRSELQWILELVRAVAFSLAIMLPAAGFAQLARYDSVALGPRGPVPGASVAICTFPGTNVSTTPCSPLNSLFSESISSITASGGVVQVATASAHGLAPGAQVLIGGVSGGSFLNGPATVATIPTTTTFTYLNSSASGSGSGGTVSGQNPIQADALGNFFFLAVPGRYSVEIYGPQVAAPIVMQGVTLPCDPISACGTNFGQINTGTNTTATLTLGSGSTLSFGGGAVNGTLDNANAGTFGSSMGEFLESTLNSCSPQTLFQASHPSSFATDAIAGCTIFPSTATNLQSNAVAGYSKNLSSSVSGGGGLGGYFQGEQSANSGASWGANMLVQDDVGVSSDQLAGIEIDTNVFGSPARVWGLLFNGASSGTMPSGVDNDAAILVGSPSGGSSGTVRWHAGADFRTSCCDTGAINVEPLLTGNSQPSMSILLNSTSSTGANQQINIAEDGNGLFSVPCAAVNIALASGFNGGSITTGHTGNCAVQVTIGSGTAVNTGVLTMTNDSVGWVCMATNQNRADVIQETAQTTTSVTLTNFGTTFSATNWTNGDTINVLCEPR